MAKKRTRLNVDEQKQLPTMEDDKDPAIESKARAYAAKKNTWSAAAEEMDLAHEALKKIMHEKGRDHYRNGKLEVTLTNKERCKVKTDAEPSENGESE